MRNALLCLLAALLLTLSTNASAGVPYPVVTLSKTVSPNSVAPAAAVTYNITLTNSGDVAANDVSVTDMLPAGFSYRAGTTRIYRNGVLIR